MPRDTKSRTHADSPRPKPIVRQGPAAVHARNRFKLLLAVGTSILLALVVIRFASIGTAQVNNSIRLLRVHREITERASQAGSYPGGLSESDHWGRPLFYRSSDAGFVLVSFGADGNADSARYEELIGRKDTQKSSTCGDWNKDTVFTESGPVQACLK